MEFLSICPWFDNKSAALVLSYDDWSPGHQLAVRDLIEREMVATFFVTLKYTDPAVFPAICFETPYELMRHAIGAGIEIANHTQEHSFLTQLSDEDLQKEINGARKKLEELLSPYACETFTYTYGLFDERVMKVAMQEHIAARTTALPEAGWKYDFAETEEDYFRLATKEIGTDTSLDEIKKSIENALETHSLLTFMMHSIDGSAEGISDVWWQPITLEKHSALLHMVKQYGDKVWITTLRDAVKYHKLRKHAVMNVVEEKGKLKVSVKHNLDKRYNVPLSLQIENAEGKVESIMQAGVPLRFSASDRHVYFNLLPDNGEIIIELSSEYI